MKLLKMKFTHYLNNFFFIKLGIIFSILFFSTLIRADTEEKLKEITSKLRCMTCQNQTIYSSDADFSLDIKKIVKEKLENNETEGEIINFLVYRYGEYIIFEPQISKQNIFLWLFPFIILALCLIFFIFKVKKSN